MASLRNPRRVAAALLLGVAASWPLPAWAQRTGPSVSSGSGPGTGTGAEAGSGLGTTGTGTESGTGLGTTGTGMEAPGRRGYRNLPYLPVPPGSLGGVGGGQPRFPGDLTPPMGPDGATPFGAELGAKQLTDIYASQLARARAMTQPGERAMAFNRIAESAVFTSRLPEAHAALQEAREAGLREPDAEVRNQRLESTITQLMALAEAQVREGVTEDVLPALETAENARPRRIQDRMFWLDMAEGEWQSAADLTQHLTNPNFRTQLMFEVVRSQAGGSQVIANQVLRASLANSNLVKDADRLNGKADRQLVLASQHARVIERPVWRDRALVEIAANAAISNQFTRGVEIARMVPQPQIRTDGLLRLAEAQARKGFHDGATGAYREAAYAVASIPQQDPRTILAGVLVDSLVSVGRFDDARACIHLFPDYSRQIEALGAIARSQGSRGAADSARMWIAREGPLEYRSYLYRKVNEGILAAVDKNRSTALSNQSQPQQ